MTALEPLPPSYGETREALHSVAAEIVAPAEKPDNEIALARTPGGFGTPPFEHHGRRLAVRVEGAELVVDEDGATRREPITSLAAAADFVGDGLFFAGRPTDTTALAVDPEAAARLADVFEFADTLLGAFRTQLPARAEASPIILWPEHFDIAFEAGSQAGGGRANYGVSPGDGEHPEPYVYVGPWSGEVSGELWNATAFPGAEVGYADLLAVADPQALAAQFLMLRYAALSS